MAYDFNDTSPIYLQLIQVFCEKLIARQWKAGEKIPPVRELAVEYGVNPNTVQRALTQMEQEGLLYTQRTSGRYITEDVEYIRRVRDNIADDYIDEFINKMLALGLNKEELEGKLTQKWRELNGNH